MEGFSESERRRPHLRRKPVQLTIRVRSRAEELEAAVLDLSAGGCRIEWFDPIAVGEEIEIAFDGGVSVDAEVRWVGDAGLGALFDLELSAAEMGLVEAAQST
jgi:hypothetical protein